MDEFPHHIVFQKKTTTSDGLGGGTESWTDFFDTEAHVQPISGYSRIVAQAQETPITTRVYFPYTDTSLPPSQVRIQYGTKILAPQSDPIDQGGLHEVMMVECYE
ncbi:phage head closure protein [Salimicrobium album]|uniref:Phage head-tail adaptor, putative, SPP1 family n=1 Tax=Salimicrobium album TaxID=50717 RepID=A0A1H3D8I2_9BACI|nr:phage head closure protein [Salimicrobium album]SDX62695.1 phage head-tail adaptor, putative, SPP1 family [Salimicrobium album]